MWDEPAATGSSTARSPSSAAGDGADREVVAEGPWFEELAVGQVFDTAPAVTLTPAHAAVHQAIVGDRLRLPLDAALCERVLGGGVLAHPALVWDMVIGQSTLATQHVKANLFYRGLVFRRAPLLGDTLRTRTEVVALRQNSSRPGRPPTGLAALRVSTVDQHDRPVLDFWRCAMLPLRADVDTGHRADLDAVGRAPTGAELAAVGAGWRLDAFRRAAGANVTADHTIRVAGGDVVTGAPELARLTLNVARVHHDAEAGGGTRLVYGGHAVGLALAQATRALPDIVTVVGWHGCDHLGPLHEGETVRSALTVQRVDAVPHGRIAHLRCRAAADGPRDVLDWRVAVLLA